MRNRAAIVERAREGDRDAFAVLVRDDADRCHAVAYRILRDVDMARDAVQETFLEAWRGMGGLRDVERFDGWLMRLLIRTCHDELRRWRRFDRSIANLALVPSIEPDAAETLAEREAMSTAFRRLTPDQRSILVLHYYLDMPLQEIARILDIPAGTARSRLHYGHLALKASLGADERAETRERSA